MRPSNRDSILDAAVRVVNRDGVTAITFETVAAEAGVTRGGMLYHFASREALILAINQHLAQQWEAQLQRLAGRAPDTMTAVERQQVYVQASVHAATRAELLFLLEFSQQPEFREPWNRIVDAWTVPEPQGANEAQALSHFLVRLAADGLWAYEYVSGRTLPKALRQRAADQLTQALGAQPTANAGAGRTAAPTRPAAPAAPAHSPASPARRTLTSRR